MSRACAECSSATEDDAELCPPCIEEADAAAPRRAYVVSLAGVTLAEVTDRSWGHALMAHVCAETMRVGTCDSSDPRVRVPDLVARADGTRSWRRFSWGWHRESSPGSGLPDLAAP